MGLTEITERLRAAEAKAGRPEGSVTLIAISKVQPLDRVEAVLDAGHRVFGENKVQEAEGKWPGFRDRYGPVELHLVGPLQTNKARGAVALFDAIHSVDRPKLARTLVRLMDETGRRPACFVQVNTGEEEQKSGVAPDAAADFVAECRGMGLPVAGLMCIPPVDEDPARHFARLAGLAAGAGVEGLSMGMSDDFERAVAEGATHVRVGSALFGARAYG